MSSKIHLSTTLTCHQIFGNFNQICLSQENPFNLIERHIFATQDAVNVQKPMHRSNHLLDICREQYLDHSLGWLIWQESTSTQMQISTWQERGVQQEYLEKALYSQPCKQVPHSENPGPLSAAATECFSHYTTQADLCCTFTQWSAI